MKALAIAHRVFTVREEEPEAVPCVIPRPKCEALRPTDTAPLFVIPV